MIKSKLKTSRGGVFLLLTFLFFACANGSSGEDSDYSPESKWQKGTYLAVCYNQKVQQMGTYEYLLEHPANRSVLTVLTNKYSTSWYNGKNWVDVPNISYEESTLTSTGTNLIATTSSKTLTIASSTKDKLKNYEGKSVWVYQEESLGKNIFFAKNESNPESEINILETPDDSWKDSEQISRINNYLGSINTGGKAFGFVVVIHDNSIYQTGEYQYIYNHPFNKTVALATGGMNFIEVEVQKIENPNSTYGPFIIVEHAGKNILPTEEQQEGLKKFIGKKVTLGIRLEDFYYKETSWDENNIEAKVKSIEEFEFFYYIHFMLGSTEIIAKIPKNDKSNFYIGETINIKPAITRCKFFEKNSNPYEEKNICEKVDPTWEKDF